jgi:glycosyltransferase involved in cell wall biosynthesis
MLYGDKFKMITVSIPYYNTPQYLETAIDPFLESDFVSEIIIHDDCSSQEILLTNPKVKVYRNEKNLGAFKNKYLAVSKSTNEWVYLLDSDNYICNDTLDVIKNINYERGICYLASKIKLVDDGLDKSLDGQIKDFNFGLVDVDVCRKYLGENKSEFRWFVNLGNFIVNRDDYVNAIESVYNDMEYPFFEADAIAFTYNWLKVGNKLKSVDGLCYNHRTRPKSYSHVVGNKNWMSIEYHLKKILEL